MESIPKTPAEGLEYVLLTGNGVKTPVGAATSFSSLVEAVQAAGQCEFRPADADKIACLAMQIEIVCRRPGESVRSGRKPWRRFYVNVWASSCENIEGEGTESFPWCGLNRAAEAVLSQCKEGKLRLEPGQRLLISHKEPFTPSILERRKKIKEAVAKYVFWP